MSIEHIIDSDQKFPWQGKNRRDSSLKSRADDLLISTAALGLIAMISDGEPDYREISCFTDEFRKKFALSKKYALKLINAALKGISDGDRGITIDTACDTLNEHLNPDQKLKLFETLTEVLIADGTIHTGEEYFLDYIAIKLDLVEMLEKAYSDL